LRTPQADPALIHGYTGMNVEQATDLEIVLTSWAIPPFDEAIDGRPWGYASATGTLRIDGPVTVSVPQEADEDPDEPQPDPMRFTLSDATLDIDTAELGDALYIAGSMLLDGGQITLDHTVTNLADESGRIDAAG